MKATYSMALDESFAAQIGGKYSITVHFDDEPEEMILLKATAALKALRTSWKAPEEAQA